MAALVSRKSGSPDLRPYDSLGGTSRRHGHWLRMGARVPIALLLTFLGSALWFAFEGGNLHGEAQMSGHAWAAIVPGAMLLLASGICLMALVFFSSRKRYGRPPQREADPLVRSVGDDTE